MTMRLLLNTLGISQSKTSSSAAATALIELRQSEPRIELLISGVGGQRLDSAVEFAKAREMRLLGALSKPVTLDALTDCFKISDHATGSAPKPTISVWSK